jgi:hypothetical protein
MANAHFSGTMFTARAPGRRSRHETRQEQEKGDAGAAVEEKGRLDGGAGKANAKLDEEKL